MPLNYQCPLMSNHLLGAKRSFYCMNFNLLTPVIDFNLLTPVIGIGGCSTIFCIWTFLEVIFLFIKHRIKHNIYYHIHLRGIFQLINIKVPTSKADLNNTQKIPFS